MDSSDDFLCFFNFNKDHEKSKTPMLLLTWFHMDHVHMKAIFVIIYLFLN